MRRAGAMRSATRLLVLCAVLLLGGASCVSSEPESGSDPGLTSSTDGPAGITAESVIPVAGPAPDGVSRVEKLTLVAPPGPMAIPMAYLVTRDRLAHVAQETELIIWENGDQLKAIVAGGQGDFVTVPSNNAAIFYNKGLELQLLGISVWNITYLVTSDAQASSFSDIRGQSLAVSLQGSVPDVMFQYLATSEGLDVEKDFDLRYTAAPAEAAQLLLAGKVQNAVLSEALATSVILQSQERESPLRRALAFDEAWASATGVSAGRSDSPYTTLLTPIAGVVATPTVMDRPDLVEAFSREYTAAILWMQADPEGAGELVEQELPQLGLKAAVMTDALENIFWAPLSAAAARDPLEDFYSTLMGLSPAIVGGKLPDDGFYYSP